MKNPVWFRCLAKWSSIKPWKILSLVLWTTYLLGAGEARADGQVFSFMVAASTNAKSTSALPDMPEPQIEAVVEVKATRGAHQRFYSGRTSRITLALEVAAWTADMAYTCRNLNDWHAGDHGHESWLPADNCGQTIALTAGFHAAGEGLAYLLHRLGHHKLEQIPRWYLTAGNIAGAAYSSANAWHPAHAGPVN